MVISYPGEPQQAIQKVVTSVRAMVSIRGKVMVNETDCEIESNGSKTNRQKLWTARDHFNFKCTTMRHHT
jgi:hypothetical protein